MATKNLGGPEFEDEVKEMLLNKNSKELEDFYRFYSFLKDNIYQKHVRGGGIELGPIDPKFFIFFETPSIFICKLR